MKKKEYKKKNQKKKTNKKKNCIWGVKGGMMQPLLITSLI